MPQDDVAEIDVKQRAEHCVTRSGGVPLQLSLFEAGQCEAAVAQNPNALLGSASLRKVASRSHDLLSIQLKQAPEVRLVCEDDIPAYPADLVAAVVASISELPSDQIWFTYKSIQRSFGVSRATVARRMRQGLVPGVRFREGRMVDEGAVRRFDRLQLRYLLLSVRSGGRPV